MAAEIYSLLKTTAPSKKTRIAAKNLCGNTSWKNGVSRIHISEEFKDWAVKYLKDEHEQSSNLDKERKILPKLL